MENTTLIALSRQMTLERQLDVVANNVANVGTDGFRGERLAFRESMSRASQTGPTPTTLRYTELEESRVDLTEGALRETGNPLDLAISGGDSFFTVQTPEGERYTRAGSFVVGANGVVQTHDGFPLIADGPRDQPRSAIIVPPGTTQISVAPDGTLSAGEQAIGRVGLARFARSSDIVSAGGAMYDARPGASVTRVTDGSMVQGFLETANVGPITGMNELITASRTFESFQRVIQTFRSLDERTARDLAKG